MANDGVEYLELCPRPRSFSDIFGIPKKPEKKKPGLNPASSVFRLDNPFRVVLPQSPDLFSEQKIIWHIPG